MAFGSAHLKSYILTANIKGELLLTKRHREKPFGGLWECTGGSVVAGENSLSGAKRELQEEEVSDARFVSIVRF